MSGPHISQIQKKSALYLQDEKSDALLYADSNTLAVFRALFESNLTSKVFPEGHLSPLIFCLNHWVIYSLYHKSIILLYLLLNWPLNYFNMFWFVWRKQLAGQLRTVSLDNLYTPRACSRAKSQEIFPSSTWLLNDPKALHSSSPSCAFFPIYAWNNILSS